MKCLIIRVSSLLKGFVLAVIFSVFLQASLASAIDIGSQSDLEAIGVVGPLNGAYVVTQSFTVIAPITGDGSSYVNGTFTGTFDGGGYTISGLTKPLFDSIGVSGLDSVDGDVSDLNLASGTGESGVIGNGALANILDTSGIIDNVSFTGDVTGPEDTAYVGGLVGFSDGAISNSFATGAVEGTNYVGGLVGLLYSDGTITNSYATGAVDGINSVGGLVGLLYSDGTITNSYATGAVDGINGVGGLVGLSYLGTITNSYAAGEVVGENYVGGLVGENYGTITNSYAAGEVVGENYVGGLVGVSFSDPDSITSSYGYGEATSDGIPIEEDPYLGEGDAPEVLSIVNTPFGVDSVPAFAVDSRINLGRPYLISLIDSYDVADTEETPSFNLRSYYTQAAKSLDEALAHFGFKSNFSSHPDLGFQALEQNQSKLPAVIQLFEVSEYQNSNILLNKEDGLQLSISSYFKEPVEIWTQGLDGEYLYLGLVEFNKDGKSILPTLKFDTANTYQLLMIKAADKLNEKINLEAKVGQININVF